MIKSLFSCGTEYPFLKIILLYHLVCYITLIRRDTGRLANEAFTSNPIVLPSRDNSLAV